MLSRLTAVTSEIQNKITLLKKEGYTATAIRDYYRQIDIEIQWLALLQAYNKE